MFKEYILDWSQISSLTIKIHTLSETTFSVRPEDTILANTFSLL